MVAVGAVMRQSALRLGEDPEHWEVTGILHDLDFEECHGMQDHALITRDLLQAGSRTNHSGHPGPQPRGYRSTGGQPAEEGAGGADAVSGLVIACALVLPSKKLAEVKVSSIAKKFGNKDFARGVDRERIRSASSSGSPGTSSFRSP